MFFLTEADLREQFKTQNLSDFKLPPETRLTPGARQFLIDRGVDLYEEQGKNIKKCDNDVKNKNTEYKKLISRLKLLHAETLYCGVELTVKDIDVVQSLSKISRQISEMIKYQDGNVMSNMLECKNCTGIDSEKFFTYMDDCFEIDDFCIQHENAKNIISLHRLRILYRNFYEDIKDYNLNIAQMEEFKKYIAAIINTISRLICNAYGSKLCQRL